MEICYVCVWFLNCNGVAMFCLDVSRWMLKNVLPILMFTGSSFIRSTMLGDYTCSVLFFQLC